MSEISPTAVIGCLIDVSGSMRIALETGAGDGRAVDRLWAVLSAVLKLARAEQQHDPNALVFVGVYGLNTKAGYPAIVDLGSVVEALLSGHQDEKTGHDLLIGLANQRNLSHINKYIREKLTDDEARIVYIYLQRHPQEIDKFVESIPSEKKLRSIRTGTKAGTAIGAAVLVGAFILPLAPVAAVAGSYAAEIGADVAEDYAVDNSDALKLAREIGEKWLHDFTGFVPRPVADIVELLEQLQKYSEPGARDGLRGDTSLLDELKKYMYGSTPMWEALSQSLEVFLEHSSTEYQVLVLVSDGESTDGDPLPIASQLKAEKVTIATLYLTDDSNIPRRSLLDQRVGGWGNGQYTLFAMASRIAVVTHPIPVLASIGWDVPSSGECALYTTVCSATALKEFCSLLLSARFGSTDALLDVMGRIDLDSYVNNEHVATSRNPSDQGYSMTCYAHASAAVIHMALLRIEGREGGCPSVDDIRTRILRKFPPRKAGPFQEVLNQAMKWYRPLRFRKVDEDGARQAILRRRPVLTTFYLSKEGWDVFIKHFKDEATCASVLTRDKMRLHLSPLSDGGHAVVLIGCDPHSLTFLNSWGRKWGNNGSFSVEDASTLELHTTAMTQVDFYDVYWLESDLTTAEQKAYTDKADAILQARALQHPSIFELESRCPLCQANSPIADFTGNIQSAVCPKCSRAFHPEPGHLVQALYARAGLGDVV